MKGAIPSKSCHRSKAGSMFNAAHLIQSALDRDFDGRLQNEKNESLGVIRNSIML